MNARDTRNQQGSEHALLAECATRLGLNSAQVGAVKRLLDDGATIPFMARYRKELTGSLDEEELRMVRNTLAELAEREHRREYIRGVIDAAGKLTPELAAAISAAATVQALEDLYLPYKPKRLTRAQKARNAGLEPLAHEIYAQTRFKTGPQKARTSPSSSSVPDSSPSISPAPPTSWTARAESYICEAFPDPEAVLSGCRDIIAEVISEHAPSRAALRDLFGRTAVLRSTRSGEDEEQKFRDYYDLAEPVRRLKPHRVLALLRGQNLGVLRLKVQPDEENAVALLRTFHYRGEPEVLAALTDAYKRLLAPSLEAELLTALKARADEDAIAVFADNVRQALLEAPLGSKRVLALDPGFRTGCKLAVLDEQGDLLAHDVIYPVEPHNKTRESADTIRALVDRFGIEAIAIGNGTAGRETEEFVTGLGLAGVLVVSVNESGASIYSAGPVARREFPDLDLTLRSAVSIGRRLKDPLAELVKIDPKNIGVGQYQHDLADKSLRQALADVVGECVNRVGVDVNQASPELLTHVSGITPTLALNIVSHRAARGGFSSRGELLGVKGLGPKAYEQAAGFLRIRGGANPLDASAVHPESYKVAADILRAAGVSPENLADASRSPETVRAIEGLDNHTLSRFASGSVGMPTLLDIKQELLKPGRDPRARFEAMSFAEGVHSISDLRPGMIMDGLVTNITQFGAFVDIGVHQDGLVHVSEIADRFISDPRQELTLRQRIKVKVISVEPERKRIGLSMKQVGS